MSNYFTEYGSNNIECTNGIGRLTAKLLKKKGIVSPPTDNLIEIKKGLWVQVPKHCTIEEIKKRYESII